MSWAAPSTPAAAAAVDVVRQGDRPHGHRPDPVQPKAVDRHGGQQHGDDLNTPLAPGNEGRLPGACDVSRTQCVSAVFNAPAVFYQS